MLSTVKIIALVGFVSMQGFQSNARADEPGLNNGVYAIDVSGSADQNGGDVVLHLSYADPAKTQIKILGSSKVDGRVQNFSHVFSVKELKKISIDTSGGDGYDGNNGTDGSNGSDGSNGWDGSAGAAGCPPGNGTDGSNGSNGSDGSNGSNGTSADNGGNGGSIQVDVPSDQTELMLLVNARAYGGSGGTGGRGGAAGKGGHGGRGGAGGPGGQNNCTDEKGNATNGPNGSNGSDGYNGSDGRDGSEGSGGWNGSDGSRGSIHLNVVSAGGSKSYSDPLRLEISALKAIDDNEDGILEPGEKLHLISLTVKNDASMPMPLGQVLRLSFEDNANLTLWKAPNINLSEQVAPGETKTLNFAKGEIVFKSLDNANAVGSEVQINTLLSINSVSVQDQSKSDFSFAWPVAASAATKNTQIYFGIAKETGFAIKNLGSQVLGNHGVQGLVAYLSWSSKNILGSNLALTFAGRSVSLATPLELSDLSVAALSDLPLSLIVLAQNPQNALVGDGDLVLDLYLKDMESGNLVKVSSASSHLSFSIDLRPEAFSWALDLKKSKIKCKLTNGGLFKTHTLNKLSFNKVANTETLDVQYYNAALFGDDKSPLYKIAALDFVAFSRDLVGNANPDRVLAFLNQVLIPATQLGNKDWVIGSCEISH